VKIDFNTTYRELVRRVDSPERRDPKELGAAGFQTMLASIAPNRSQPTEALKVSNAEPAPIPAPPLLNEGPMARFNFPPAQPLTPRSTQILEDEVSERMANEVPESVKTPTLVGVHRTPSQDPFAGLSHDERVVEVKRILSSMGEKHGIDPALGLAVASRESGFNPNAVSNDGHNSKGLFQLLDSTGREAMGKLGLKESYNPFDPNLNAELGISHMRYLHDLFSTPSQLANGSATMAAANITSLEKLALAAYNAGEGRVAAAQERSRQQGSDPAAYEQVERYLPESTQKYVRDVYQMKALFTDDEEESES